MNVLYAASVLLVAAPASAACIDFGNEAFANDLVMVQLCIGSACELAVRTRSCGNVHYLSEDYSATSTSWLFSQRYGNANDDTDDAYFVLRDPIDPEDRPLGAVNGQDLWMLEKDLPLEADQVRQLTCVPKSGPEACAFVNSVLQNLRQPYRDAGMPEPTDHPLSYPPPAPGHSLTRPMDGSGKCDGRSDIHP